MKIRKHIYDFIFSQGDYLTNSTSFFKTANPNYNTHKPQIKPITIFALTTL